MLKLDDLHDAVLHRVEVDVVGDSITLWLEPVQFEGAPIQISIVAHQRSHLDCPREHPWGRSAPWRVNEARGPTAADSGTGCLEIEMQSGDTVVIRAHEFVRQDSTVSLANGRDDR
jgi:hypothetical protein